MEDDIERYSLTYPVNLIHKKQQWSVVFCFGRIPKESCIFLGSSLSTLTQTCTGPVRESSVKVTEVFFASLQKVARVVLIEFYVV